MLQTSPEEKLLAVSAALAAGLAALLFRAFWRVLGAFLEGRRSHLRIDPAASR